MNNKGFLFAKAFFWGWVLILIFAGSCSTVQISERGTNQNSPGITSREVKAGKSSNVESKKIVNEEVGLKQLLQLRTKTTIENPNSLVLEAKNNYNVISAKRIDLKSKTSKDQLKKPALGVKFGIINQVKNRLPQKVKSIKNSNSVVPDYYSPVWHWILFVIGVILVLFLLYFTVVLITFSF